MVWDVGVLLWYAENQSGPSQKSSEPCPTSSTDGCPSSLNFFFECSGAKLLFYQLLIAWLDMCSMTANIYVHEYMCNKSGLPSYSTNYLRAHYETSIVGKQSLKQLVTVERAQSKAAGTYQ